VARVVILGAGLTGLSTAYHLQTTGFSNFRIFEKNATPGGLARSVKHDGFTFDFTGHALHINNNYFQSFVNNMISTQFLAAINRNSYIYSHNTYTPYPFQMNLYGLPPHVIRDCILGFVTRKKTHTKSKSFYEWVCKHFGTGLGKHFFFHYNTKQLAYDLKKIHPSWTSRFVPQINLKEFLDGALQPHSKKKIGYNHSFFYPKHGGIQSFVDAIARQIKTPPHLKYKAVSIDLKSKTIYFQNGQHEKYEKLISTLPLPELLTILDEPTSSSLQQARFKLTCNAVLNFNIGLAVPNLTKKHWVYFPEKNYPFYRLGFWHNFSSSLTPPGCSALYGEISYQPGTKTQRQLHNATQTSIKQALRLFKLNKNHILTEKILHLPYAYVIYDFWRQQHLKKLLIRLQDYDIYSVGRFGAWKYSSMQEAILDGQHVANQVQADLKSPPHFYTIIPAIKDEPAHDQTNKQKKYYPKREL
jgi:protoporphyrinogen oxidase